MEKRDAFLKRLNLGEIKGASRKELESEAKETIRAMVLDRKLERYLFSFKLRLEDLENKKILDVGSGKALFAKEAKQLGLNVTALDPLYLTKEGRGFFKKNKKENEIHHDAVAGLAQELPFNDGQFDIVFFMYSAFFYAESASNLDDYVNEGLRVLKQKGKLLIYPLYEVEEGSMTIINNNQKKEAELNKKFWNIVSKKELEGTIKTQTGMPDFKRESRARFLIIEKI